MDRGEFELIDAIRSRFTVPGGVTGIGDDCAVLPEHGGNETLVTTDMLIEGVHFLLPQASPDSVGWKSAAVNLSDIAAMGGRPVGTFLSIALPAALDSAWVSGFMDGYSELSQLFDVPLLGGDTNSSPDRLCINVTVLGECPVGKSLKRSGAVPGDIIYVSACLGDSAAGLKIILGGGPADSVEEMEVRRHYQPIPEIPLGMHLQSVPGVHAMMDISDGLASDVRHIMEASGVGAEIDVASLPMSSQFRQVCAAHGWDPVELALCGGEDYKLLFTAAPGSILPDGKCIPVGRITSGNELRWIGSDRDFGGFRHF